MLDLVETLGLEEVLRASGIEHSGRDFEGIYAEVAGDPRYALCKSEVEDRVGRYFADLEIPPQPTLYDVLVLSLRPKDVIATFNWDPFLWHALRRNASVSNPPRFFFLHGCAVVGFCHVHKVQGDIGAHCPHCDRPYQATRLLYPIADKNYAEDPYLASQWSSLSGAFSQAFVVTVFGYSAPRSDAAAITLMKGAWGDPSGQQFEEFEFIDIKTKAELHDQWDGFIFGNHCRCATSYWNSIIGTHPRRTCEAMWKELLEAAILPANRPPAFSSLAEAHRWFQRLLEIESAA